MTFHEALALLKAHGQEHVLSFYNELSPDARDGLIEQIASVDFSILDRLQDEDKPRGVISPMKVVTQDQLDARRDYILATARHALCEKKIGAVLLAGGQGTRLGFDKPKGTLDLGENRPVYLFELLISNMLDVVAQTNTYIPLFIMTSDKNDADTRAFFEEHDYFGYERNEVHFFVQEMAPSCDFSGKLYLADKGKLSTSPNGNGGWFSSMLKCGLGDTLKREGIEWLNVFSVDNPLQRIADPMFVGATIATDADCGSKVVRKASPDERVGVICLEDNHPSIIEYYEMNDEMRNERNANGELMYNYGVTLNYLFRVDKLMQIQSSRMPLHVVKKKIPHIDENGALISPQEPNGYKFETLVLDMIRLMDSCCAVEVDRNREFAPIKNKVGVDSPDTARELLRLNGIEL